MCMKKKHPFRCEKCKSECMIYKKGKGHRVFVCPECGVLATNGLKFTDMPMLQGLKNLVKNKGDVKQALIDTATGGFGNSEEGVYTASPKYRRPQNSHVIEKINLALR